ncbi:MAG: maleylpyruvate isomerase N-terminal domain-containing protein [Actinobacteria bacterium]|nr:maleylpyruvate isomerase N-terminal domain-containing protein [Actinomycetota bacterium]
MDPARHLELLRREGDLLAAMPPDALGATVPALPDWTVERVVRHVGKIHRWVTAALATPPDGESPAAEGLPKGAACLPAYATALDEVIGALAATPPDRTTWTFLGPEAAVFWMRRQAQEVAVHRIDAADAVQAAGGPEPVPMEADGAADGIDEWAEVFLAVRWHQRFGELPVELQGRTIGLRTTDGDRTSRRITLRPDGATVDAGDDADVVVSGPAEHLLLALWRRRDLDGLTIDGDRTVVDHLLDVARF